MAGPSGTGAAIASTVVVITHRGDVAVGPELRAALSRVEVCSHVGYIWRLAKKEGVRVMYRGIRSWKQDGREERILLLLNILGPFLLGPLQGPVESRFIDTSSTSSPSQALHRLSSSLVRKAMLEGQTIDSLVPQCIAKELIELYSQ